MTRILSAVLVALLLTVPLFAGLAAGPSGPIGGKTSASADSLMKMLTRYNIAVFSKGPKFAGGIPEEVKRLQADMKKSVAALVQSGTLVGAVQVHDAPEVQWVHFFKTESLEQTSAIMNGAPSVAAGVYTPSAHKIWGTRGLGAKYKADAKTKEDLHMVVFTKGDSWRSEADAVTREKIAEASDYVWNAYKKGNVRFYAVPADSEAKIRLLLIGKGKSLKDVAAAVNATSTVKSGWFKAEVFKVTVAEGVLP
jgi:hypothetical protein